MKLKTYLLLLLSVLFCLHAEAQLNLVRNCSFEEYDTCPTNIDQVRYASYWNYIDTNYSVDSVSFYNWDPPEYINGCSNSYFATEPENVFAWHYPRTGNGMVHNVMGNWNFFPTLPNYFQGKIVTPLIAGKSYCVSFYVVRDGHCGGLEINKIGAYLDDGSIDTTRDLSNLLSQYSPQVFDTLVVSDTLNWTKIQGSFVANGGERFITIGLFFDTANVTYSFSGSGVYSPTYLFDDISVVSSDSVAYAGPDVTIAHSGDTAVIGRPSGADCILAYWYQLGNPVAIDSGGSTRVHPDTTTSYVVAMDLCGHVTYDTVTVHVHSLSVNSLVRQLGNVTIYPNPASQFLNVENAKGCSVVFSDAVGTTALRASLVSDKETIDISRLEQGMYFMHFADKVTGEEVVRKVVKE